MEFHKYIHLERFGTDEVDGINLGECYIFPKLDGTNASLWINEEGIQAGSRNRHLSLDADNAGFLAWAMQQDNHREMLMKYPNLRWFGEFLVKHSLDTYREDAWRRFYIFDCCDQDGNFLRYEEYSKICQEFNLDFIPCLTKTRNPDYEVLQKSLENNRWLIQDGKGTGEGIVIKNYDFKNRFGRQVWAKMITNTFKDKHIEVMGGTVVNLKMLEEEICDKYIDIHQVEKIISKIRLDVGAFNAKQIPQLLGMAYHDLITEDMWEIVKTNKNPKIDFKTLNQFCIRRVKALKPELFGG